MPKITNPPRPIDLANPPPLATIGEVQMTLRKCRASIYRDIAAGNLEAIKIGSATRIRTASVIKMLEAAPAL